MKEIIWTKENGKIVNPLLKDFNLTFHRTDGPAVTKWYDNVQKEYEIYYLNSNIHRTDGPDIIYWFENGQKAHEAYWLNNIKYDKNEYEQILFNRKLKLL